MPWVIHQDYAHHVSAAPERVLAPWHLFGRAVAIPIGIAKVWLPAAKVGALEQQVEREYEGDPPPVDPKPIPDPPRPDEEGA